MNTRTLTRLGLSAALGAVFAALWLHPPTARADSSSFLDEVHGLGWYSASGGDAQLLRNGNLVCNLLGSGRNGLQVAQIIYNNTGLDVDANDAAEFVIASVENLCPEYDGRNAQAGRKIA